ncbi:MAG TPA: sugar ABC transporter permease, partial [Caldilineaceae bacterium]|nr:sugar ABC transporter permease [Caldilineaceae bacterium]
GTTEEPMYRNKYRLIVPFLIPSILLYITFVLYPYGRAMYISLTQWRGLSKPPVFIGLENFSKMLGDSNFWNALGNNAFYIVSLPIFTIGLALFFAFVLTQGARFARLYRITFFFPQVMSMVAIGVLWSFIYHPTIGFLNSFLKLIGMSNPPVWLGNPDYVLTALSGVAVWQAVGFFMVLFIAAMESIPATYYEAAMIDGASQWHIFWNITIPLIWGTIQTALIFIMIEATSMFTITQTMTEGGPSRGSEVLSTYLYHEAFINSNFGYGTAIAVALFFLTLFISVILTRLLRRESLEF